MTEIKTSDLPYLVQRVKREDRPDKKGIDKLFSFDYMGAAEFEFGLFSSLKLMREACTKKWRVGEIAAANAVAYYVGAPQTIALATALFEDQLKGDAHQGRTKMPTWLHTSYFPDKRDRYPRIFDGWWAIEIKLPFVLFKQKDHAEAWLGAL